ncbi:MAG: DUF2167 domain-containing protein [Chthoniobacteraceae bacterium]
MKHIRFGSVLAAALALLILPAFADDSAVTTKDEAQAIVSSLRPQKGNIVIGNGVAKLNVPEQFVYLDSADADSILVRLWHNPPGTKVLGMLMPANSSPLSPDNWAVTIEYEEDGYVKDDDAGKINYNDLLKQMNQGAQEANAEREKQGYPAVQNISWAETPSYDQATHKLYWAKDISFAGEEEHTLNYNIRVLGRRGVLVLNAIAGVSQLPEIKKSTPQILSMVDFNEGSRYTDFNSSTDKVATYGIAALVAGGVAAKLGLFKVIIAGLIAAKKFVVMAVVAVVAAFKKFFKKKEPMA